MDDFWNASIDIETCRDCGGAVEVIPKALAALAGQALKKILAHLDENTSATDISRLPESRAPPQISLFDREGSQRRLFPLQSGEFAGRAGSPPIKKRVERFIHHDRHIR
ncbi:MAG: hypothetical protein BMS9Abin06_0616 [Gammaproteobacteria bacterium]|nr:MAG: hypothetical protein BMS9Abin06_0616 [Gammaproteobacteria bacterium]